MKSSQNKIEEGLHSIQERMENACVRVGRSKAEVRLVAVSKLQTLEKIEQAYHCGQRDFGENYVQELVEKKEKLAHLKDIRWHLIGHLQSNKSKLALSSAHFFHALDSQKLVVELEKHALKMGLEKWPVFIQVNVDEESSKSGTGFAEAAALAQLIRSKPVFDLRGLMCIPRTGVSLEESRLSFKKVAALKKQLDLPELSMGMSEDFEVAIEEGSNWIRVGRSIFGERA